MSAVIQGTDAWRALRAGKVTASRISDLCARTKSGYSTSRQNYLAELVAERLTGVPAEGFTSAAMSWGTATEPLARDAYSFYADVDVEQVGFIEHPRIPMTGCSPDGCVGETGLVEIKAPLTSTHIETLLGGSIPSKYVLQMQFQMACTGRLWADYVSFDPRMPAHMQLFVCRLPRDEVKIKEIEAEVEKFLAELAVTVNELNARYGMEKAA